VKTEADPCPYVGLRPFTQNDRRYFFGRDREQRVIFSSLSASPLTVLYGPSGTGKSSVLQAGLLPMVRVRSRRTGIVYFNRWHNAAFLEDLKQRCIAEARHVAREKNFPINAALPLNDLLVQLQRHLSRPLLIILDQFEEYLLDYPETSGNLPFESELARAVTLAGGGTSFLIALREDSLSRLDRFRTRIPNLLGNTLRLEALNRRGAEEAIRKPLEVYRKRHGKTSGPIEIEGALVAKVLDQVCLVHAAQLGDAADEGVPGTTAHSDKIEAAILQLVMRRLWDEERNASSTVLRFDTLNRLGGAAHIVETHFTRAMDKFTSAERETCAAIFRFLVRPSGEKIAYTPGDLAASAERSPEEVSGILKKLVDSSILRKTDAPERFELLHDILGPAVLAWRNRHVQMERLATEVAQREAQLAAARRSRITRTAIASAVLLFALVIFSVTQWIRASRAVARTTRDLAQLVAAKFQEEASKSDAASGKDLLFLLRARDILKANFKGNLQAEQLTVIDARLADAINSWSLPPAGQYAFTNPRHPSGDFVTVDDRAITWWDVEKRQKGREMDIETHRVVDSVEELSRDGRRIVLSTFKGIVIWDLVKEENAETLLFSGGKVRLHVLAPSDVDDRLLMQRGNRLEVWEEDDNDFKPKQLPAGFKGDGLLFRANTSQVVALDGQVLKVKDVKSRAAASREFRSSRGGIKQFALSSDGNLLAFAESDGTIRLADLNDQQKKDPRILSATLLDWKSLAFQLDSKRLAGFAADGQVFIWNVQNGKREETIALRPAEGIVFSHDLRWLATSSSGAVMLHALTPLNNVVAEAKKRAKGELGFEDIVVTYNDLTKEFRAGIDSARNELDTAAAAKHFRNAIGTFRNVDYGLQRINPDHEARRLAAEGFLARAEKEARKGEYKEAQKYYAEARKLNSGVDPKISDKLLNWSIESLLRRADVAASNGDLDPLKDVRAAQSLGAQVDSGAENRLIHTAAQVRVDEGRSKLDSGERQAAMALFQEALKLDPSLATSLDPQREVQRAQARDLLQKASDSLKANRIAEAIRQFAKAKQLAGPIGGQEFAESQALGRAGYDTLTGGLEIEFRSGAAYRYAAVPPQIYDSLLRAESKGRYFSEEIRGKYSFERLERRLLAPVPLGDQPTIGSFVGELLRATDKAVAAAPANVALRQVRGVARAIASDLTGAADDLMVFASDPSQANSDFARENKAWAGQLRQGTNPFTPEVLDKIPIP
jgi:WD40 repeat protein